MQRAGVIERLFGFGYGPDPEFEKPIDPATEVLVGVYGGYALSFRRRLMVLFGGDIVVKVVVRMKRDLSDAETVSNLSILPPGKTMKQQ